MLEAPKAAKKFFGLNGLVPKAPEKIFDWLKTQRKICPITEKGGGVRGGGGGCQTPPPPAGDAELLGKTLGRAVLEATNKKPPGAGSLGPPQSAGPEMTAAGRRPPTAGAAPTPFWGEVPTAFDSPKSATHGLRPSSAGEKNRNVSPPKARPTCTQKRAVNIAL